MGRCAFLSLWLEGEDKLPSMQYVYIQQCTNVPCKVIPFLLQLQNMALIELSYFLLHNLFPSYLHFATSEVSFRDVNPRLQTAFGVEERGGAFGALVNDWMSVEEGV
jgi:hypothetical protein